MIAESERASDRIYAEYRIETPNDVAATARAMANEQSTGTFVALPGEPEDLHARHGAVVELVEPEGDAPEPALIGRYPVGARFRRARVVLSFPLENVGTSLPNLLATVAGNLFELRELSGIRLEDLQLPTEFGRAHPGPQFGVDGTRRLAGVPEGPVIGTIIKPSVGLRPEETATLAGELADGGIDFIKDDELMANPPHSPFDRRVEAVLGRLRDSADRTGKGVMYAANVTDELDEMRRHVDRVVELGGTCIMVSLNAVGPVALGALRRHSPLPIHGHRNGWGALTRSPLLGYSYRVWQRLWRLAGADHLHVNGLRNKFWEPDASVIESATALLAPENGHGPVLPVFSSAQTVLQVADTHTAIGAADLMYVCGGGIMAHPDGVTAGVRSIREAWRAAMSGIAVDEHARAHGELRRALEFFQQHTTTTKESTA